MVKKWRFSGMVGIIAVLLSISNVFAVTPTDEIRLAASDLRVFCPASETDDVQWSALMYLNQVYGAEVYVALIKPAPVFGLREIVSSDGAFHLLQVGLGYGMDGRALADSLSEKYFDHLYPQLALYESRDTDQAEMLTAFLTRLKSNSQTDNLTLAPLSKIYYLGRTSPGADVIFNDREIFTKYSYLAEKLDDAFSGMGPGRYVPQIYRHYYLTEATDDGEKSGDFITPEESFNLPHAIEKRLPRGSEKSDILESLSGYRSHLSLAQGLREGSSDQLQAVGKAYREISDIVNGISAGGSYMAQYGGLKELERLQAKSLNAFKSLAGIECRSELTIKDTPLGEAARLLLDVEVNGPKSTELSYFRYHEAGFPAVIIDSISRIIEPHQRFYRIYPVNLNNIRIDNRPGDTLLFSIEVIVDGIKIEIPVPYREYSYAEVNVEFLPGYSFLSPFTEDQLTSLAQPFDWQVMITKPYGMELKGKLDINNPDGIVVGSYDENIDIPAGLTRKYMNIYLAAGRSIGYDIKTVSASLIVGGREEARAYADVRVVRCQIPETRDFALVPDSGGVLEDFMRMAHTSFIPFTRQGLIRAPLEAYDAIIIGPDAEQYWTRLRSARERLRQFVYDGGEVIIFGQGFGFPADLFEFSINSSHISAAPAGQLNVKEHQILKYPYNINLTQLLGNAAGRDAWPARVGDGAEIVSAGEPGGYLYVTKVGEGYVIYCGLPLMEMAAELDVETIHFLANILNFGHGE